MMAGRPGGAEHAGPGLGTITLACAPGTSPPPAGAGTSSNSCTEALAGSTGDLGDSSFSGVLRRGVLGGSSCNGVGGGALTALRPILEGKGSEAQAMPKAEKDSWRAMLLCYNKGSTWNDFHYASQPIYTRLCSRLVNPGREGGKEERLV